MEGLRVGCQLQWSRYCARDITRLHLRQAMADRPVARQNDSGQAIRGKDHPPQDWFLTPLPCHPSRPNVCLTRTAAALCVNELGPGTSVRYWHLAGRLYYHDHHPLLLLLLTSTPNLRQTPEIPLHANQLLINYAEHQCCRKNNNSRVSKRRTL